MSHVSARRRRDGALEIESDLLDYRGSVLERFAKILRRGDFLTSIGRLDDPYSELTDSFATGAALSRARHPNARRGGVTRA